MSRERLATVDSIVPQDGRKRGFIKVVDSENSLHYFYDPEWMPKFPGLNAGDKVRIVYTSTASRGGWYISEILDLTS